MTSPEENLVSRPEEPEQATSETPGVPVVEQTAAPAPPVEEPAPVRRPVQAPYRGETLLQSLLSIMVIVLFVITFIVQAFQIPSPSMEKTLLVGDYLLVDKLHFGESGLFGWFVPYRPLERGDIVVFRYPVDPTQHFVKRVVGIPGDHILMRDKTVFVNDMALPSPHAIHVRGDNDLYRDNFPSERDTTGQVDEKWRAEMPRHMQDGELVVPPNEYFVMGDNRDRSLDSRYWGFVPRENIVGRPLVIYLSVRQRQTDAGGDNDKLSNSGHLLAHLWQFARWDRMFHLVR